MNQQHNFNGDFSSPINTFTNSYNNNNIPHNDNTVIQNLGVSKRLGSSVLDELNSRTDAKFNQLRTTSGSSNNNNDNDNNPQSVSSFSRFFNIKQNSQFQNLPVANNHYPSRYNQIDMSSYHPDNNSDDDDDDRNDDNSPNRVSFVPRTPMRKNVKDAQLQSESIKRLKTMSKGNDSPPATPQISDITRRIRRLRIRKSIASGGGNNNHANTREGNSNKIPEQNKVKNTPLTTKQKPLELPSFLQPTFNSLKKINRIPSRQQQHDINIPKNEQRRYPSASTSNTHNMHSNMRSQKMRIASENISYRSKNSKADSNNNREPVQVSERRIKSTGSSATAGNTTTINGGNTSVFDRLYSQNTMSRSISMNLNQEQDNQNVRSRSRIGFGRSTTSSNLSNNSRKTSASDNQNTNGNITRRVWR